jgi:hypothetical protein
VPYYCYFVFINLLKIIHEREGIRARAGVDFDGFNDGVLPGVPLLSR